MSADLISNRQEEVIEEFSLFDDWMDKYEHLIELGKDVPAIDHHEFTLVEFAGLRLPNWVQALDRPLHLVTHTANIAPSDVNLGCTRARSSTLHPHRLVQVGLLLL